MNLYMVLYASGVIAGVWGPLPYDEAECSARAHERMAEVQQSIETGRGAKGNPIPPDVIQKLRGWKLSCEHRATRPVLSAKREG